MGSSSRLNAQSPPLAPADTVTNLPRLGFSLRAMVADSVEPLPRSLSAVTLT